MYLLYPTTHTKKEYYEHRRKHPRDAFPDVVDTDNEEIQPRRQRLDYARVKKLTRQGLSLPGQITGSFRVYHCNVHAFDPDPATIMNKCLKRRCNHLTIQKRSKIIVKTLEEAVNVKNKLGNAWIEQVESGFRITLPQKSRAKNKR